MVWTCAACTVINDKEWYLCCEVCGAARQDGPTDAPEPPQPAPEPPTALDGDSDDDPDEPARKRARAAAETVRIGRYRVSPVGFGTLALGVLYPDGRPSRGESVAMIRRALANGCTFFDTADVYCANEGELHYAERVLADALSDAPAGACLVSTKGGCKRRGDGTESSSWAFGHRIDAAGVRAAVAASRRALGARHPVIWSLHNTDAFEPDSPEFAAILVAMRDAADAGDCDALGLSNASARHVEAAHDALGARLVAVQNELSLWARQALKPRKPNAAKSNRSGVLAVCASRDVAFVAFGVFGGLASRRGKRDARDAGGLVWMLPAARHGASIHTILLKWVLQQQHPASVVALVGARREAHVPNNDLVCATERLTPHELGLIEEAKAPPTRK